MKVLGIAVLVTGLTVSAGWFLNDELLKSIIPNQVTMKFSTAVSFVFTGASLYFLVRIKEGKASFAHIVLPTAGLVIILLMTTVTVSVLLGVNTNIEKLFVEEGQQVALTTKPGQPSLSTMMNFTLIAAAIVMSLSEFQKLNRHILAIGVVVTVIGSIALIGYASKIPELYYYVANTSTAMALHTAILFVAVGSALILIGKSKEEVETIQSVKIRTRLVSLFLILSLVPIIFIGTLAYTVIREFQTQTLFENSFLIIGLLTAIVVGIFAYLITKNVVRPIMSLRDTAILISKGNISIKAKEYVNDEIGQLANSFNNMMERLREINKEKEEFAAMISHELKTPLVPIQGYSELLVKGRLGELTELQKKSAKTIFDNATRLSRLIQDILDVRKMELGRLNLDIRDANAKEIIGQCLTAFKTTSQPKGITLVDNSQDISLRCDPERIIQVINNLLSNSFKFVPQENGKIELDTKIENGFVIFSIKDNGIGIPKDKQDSLFKKFYQVDTTLGRKAGGSGLGLVICKGIIESHKGKIWVESEPGKGTIIYFSIPMEVIR